MERTNNYYVATLKGGHVRQKNYIEFKEPIIAANKKEAAEKCMRCPRAKKGQKDMIISIEKISYEEYLKICEEERNNPYKFCKNKQEQEKYMDELKDFIKLDLSYTNKDIEKEKNRQLGTANNKKRYANRYSDTYTDWKKEKYEYAA